MRIVYRSLSDEVPRHEDARPDYRATNHDLRVSEVMPRTKELGCADDQRVSKLSLGDSAQLSAPCGGRWPCVKIFRLLRLQCPCPAVSPCQLTRPMSGSTPHVR
jgi:hypothetical protein